MIAVVLSVVAMAVCTMAFIALVRGRIPARTAFGAVALGNGLACLGSVLAGRTMMAGLSAGAAALMLWLWWNRGGGDGTRRRLRTLRRQFTGVRRTAPAAAS